MTLATQGFASISNGVIVSFGYGDIIFVVYFDAFDFDSFLTIQVDLISALLTLLNTFLILTQQIDIMSFLTIQVEFKATLTTQTDYISQLL